MTDVHFHLVMLGVLFLAVPRVPWRRRMENLGWAVLVTVFFDIFLIFFYVKFTYATQLGAWSLAHYGAFAAELLGPGQAPARPALQALAALPALGRRSTCAR